MTPPFVEITNNDGDVWFVNMRLIVGLRFKAKSSKDATHGELHLLTGEPLQIEGKSLETVRTVIERHLR